MAEEWEEWRILQKGEVIQEGDEVDCCNDGWRDEPVWKPTKAVGTRAPDPQYPSHRTYRRRKTLGVND